MRLFLKVLGGGAALVFSILAAVAQFERERIAERAAETRARLANAGQATVARLVRDPAPYVGVRSQTLRHLAGSRLAERNPANTVT